MALQITPSPSLPPAASPPPDSDDEPFFVVKRIALLGARGVGKSALSIRVAENRFEPTYMLTFQDMYGWRPVVNGVHYDVTILDTDGQDETSEFDMRYTCGVDGYVFVFSVRDESSFEVVKQVNEKLLDTLMVLDRKGTVEVPRVLVGNQIDIAHERQVSTQDAAAYAKAEGIPYLETSAFTPHNAEEPFKIVLRIIQHNLRESHLAAPLLIEDEEEQPPADDTPPHQACIVQ